jgi:hypothetical protein
MGLLDRFRQTITQKPAARPKEAERQPTVNERKKIPEQKQEFKLSDKAKAQAQQAVQGLKKPPTYNPPAAKASSGNTASHRLPPLGAKKGRSR